MRHTIELTYKIWFTVSSKVECRGFYELCVRPTHTHTHVRRTCSAWMILELPTSYARYLCYDARNHLPHCPFHSFLVLFVQFSLESPLCICRWNNEISAWKLLHFGTMWCHGMVWLWPCECFSREEKKIVAEPMSLYKQYAANRHLHLSQIVWCIGLANDNVDRISGWNNAVYTFHFHILHIVCVPVFTLFYTIFRPRTFHTHANESFRM